MKEGRKGVGQDGGRPVLHHQRHRPRREEAANMLREDRGVLEPNGKMSSSSSSRRRNESCQGGERGDLVSSHLRSDPDQQSRLTRAPSLSFARSRVAGERNKGNEGEDGEGFLESGEEAVDEVPPR